MEKEKIKIRPMKKYDAKAIRDIWISPEVTKYTLSRPDLTVAHIKKRLLNAESKSIVALVNNNPAGLAKLSLLRGRRNHSGEVVMFVADNHQSKGIGTMLLKEIIRIAKNKKLKRLKLEVNVDNKKAIGLYKKMGFEIEGRLRKDTQRGNKLIDNYAMALLL